VEADVAARAAVHAALGDPLRLALVDDLVASDRSPAELGERHGLSSNLLAHHLGVMERVGLIERYVSSGDRRRRYVRLVHETLAGIGLTAGIPAGRVVFVCTHNSARSQLAAALWRIEVGGEAESAGTHPADRVHPGAVAAARRFGLDLAGVRPRSVDDVDLEGAQVVTVCDRAHEELEPGRAWWHWSIPDPAEHPTTESFDRALERIRRRVVALRERSAR
jgi:ArsR family transcriptional regulator, arsenate/arsenite/antimonite-responsive transcriptional repressor / arsenate reductase (thioredoxin)